MKLSTKPREPGRKLTAAARVKWALSVLLMSLTAPASASLFKGEALDTAANVIAWIALVVAPVVAIGVFWLVHILPEKVAEKRKHPQVKAIQTLCVLSLFFGGLLWPLAWLWAYSKPVLYKLAYGTDKLEPEDDETNEQVDDASAAEQIERLQELVAALQAELKSSQSPAKEKNV